MQIVSLGDNLHEVSKPVVWKKNKKKYQFICWIGTESCKGEYLDTIIPYFQVGI